MSSIFPIVKRFQDIKKSKSTVILKEETVIHDKPFRSGTIFTIVGWREIDNVVYLILSKGSWEGLVEYEPFSLLVEKINYDLK